MKFVSFVFAQFNVYHAKIFLNFHENYLRKFVYFQVSSPQKVQVSLRANPLVRCPGQVKLDSDK